MLEVNNHYIVTDEIDILKELKSQLYINGIDVFHKTITSKNNIQTTCPFHKNGQERKPSFGIMTKNSGKYKAGICHCFSCGWSGSFQEMVSNCFGYDDMGIFGSKWLVKNFLTMSIETRPDINLGLEPEVTEKKEYISEKELSSYRFYHPYMWKRKMTPEVVDIFDIGYDSKTCCLTFPIRDIEGNCLFIARRSVNTKFFNYPEDVEKPVYGLFEFNRVMAQLSRAASIQFIPYPIIERTKEIIICESMINAITCWVYGKYAVALNGTGTDEQYEQLRKMPNRKFILALDPDKAGNKGRERLKKALTNKIVSEYIIPENKDINDLSKDEFDNLKEIFN